MNEEDLQNTLKSVMVQLGDRKHSGFCLQCGTDLLEPYNDYQACVECTKDIELAITETKNKAKHYHKNLKKPMPKKDGRVVIQSHQILRQVKPLGVPVK